MDGLIFLVIGLHKPHRLQREHGLVELARAELKLLEQMGVGAGRFSLAPKREIGRKGIGSNQRKIEIRHGIHEQRRRQSLLPDLEEIVRTAVLHWLTLACFGVPTSKKFRCSRLFSKFSTAKKPMSPAHFKLFHKSKRKIRLFPCSIFKKPIPFSLLLRLSAHFPFRRATRAHTEEESSYN